MEIVVVVSHKCEIIARQKVVSTLYVTVQQGIQKVMELIPWNHHAQIQWQLHDNCQYKVE